MSTKLTATDATIEPDRIERDFVNAMRNRGAFVNIDAVCATFDEDAGRWYVTIEDDEASRHDIGDAFVTIDTPTGMDILPLNRQVQLFADPVDRYPFAFIQGDALTVDLRGYDLIWASPPCQDFTRYHNRGPNRIAPRGNLIPPIRERLRASGAAWVIENVEGAPLIAPATLCGSMFGLEVRRHRLFESSFAIPQPACDHSVWRNEYPCAGNRTNPRRTVEVGVWRIPLAVQRAAMGVDWMSLEALSEAIPPAYAEHIGRAALAAIARAA